MQHLVMSGRRLAAGFFVLAMLALIGGTAALASNPRPGGAPQGLAGRATSSSAPRALTVEQLPAPVDLTDLTAPPLGWQVGSGSQTAYQIQVAQTPARLADGHDIWNSGKVDSSHNANVAYAGPVLQSASGYYWRVRTWGTGRSASAWSKTATFGTGPDSSTWSQTQPIWGPPRLWTDYTFQGTFKIVQRFATVSFRDVDNSNFYLWQFRGDGQNTIAPQIQVNGQFSNLKNPEPLPFALDDGTNYDFKIVVDGSTFTTYLKPSSSSDWSLVDTTTDSTFPQGGIGFRTGSTEAADFSNISVTDPTGATLYSNDFSNPANTDFPCGTISNSELVIGPSVNCATGTQTAALANSLWTNYTFQGTFNIAQRFATVSFRDVNTSNFYLWQFRGDGQNTIAPQIQVNGQFSNLKNPEPLPFALDDGTNYAFKIVVDGSTFTTYLKPSSSSDWSLVDTTTDSTFPSGGIGFRTGLTEAVNFDNISVTDPTGQVLYSNDFSNPSNNDFPCATVTNGTLFVGNSQNCATGTEDTNWAFMRGDVKLERKPIQWAHLYATASSALSSRQFVYKMWLNGQFVGVGPTLSVGSEARYDGFDVTGKLNAGGLNTVSAQAYTTSDQRFDAVLVVRYRDGTTQTFGTGPGWKAIDGHNILPNAGSDGTSSYAAPKEDYDAANFPFGFQKPGFDDSSWQPASLKAPFSDLEATATAKVQRHLERPASVVEYSPGDYFIDYGRTWIGGLSLNLKGTAGQVLDIRYGEVPSGPDTVQFQTPAGNTWEDKWTLKAGEQHLETWGLRVFRYVQITGAPPNLPASAFTAEAYIYPFSTSKAQFDSSDSNLNQVWTLSRNTIQAVNENLYVDSWERERGVYEADSYLQLMSNLYLDGDPTLGEYSLNFLLTNRTWPTEWPMYMILAYHQLYETTGDLAPLRTAYAALQSKLPNQWFDPTTGLIHKTTGDTGDTCTTDCDIVDWPATERDGYVFSSYNTVINAISYRAYADMSDIASALGDSADAQLYAQRAQAIKTAVNADMWDSQTGAYRDGLNNDGTPIDHDAIQASVFATAFGLADPARAAQAAAYIGQRGMACSVYCAAFLLEGLYDANAGQTALDMLTSTATKSWMHMISLGAGATMEDWDPSLKPNLTYSHAWAASPAFDIPQGLFGIQPTTPGYSTFAVKPQPGGLKWAHITVPTQQGEIGVAFDTSASGDIAEAVSVPANTSATVEVPVNGTPGNSVFMDGRRVAAVADGSFLEVDDVQPGCHVFAAARSADAIHDRRLLSVCSQQSLLLRQRGVEPIGPRSDTHSQARRLHARHGHSAGLGQRLPALRH